MQHFFLFIVSMGLTLGCFGQSGGNEIIITTPGYTSIYRYSTENFGSNLANDFKIETASATKDSLTENSTRITLKIGDKTYIFLLRADAPVARLQYDRNRRQFQGVGFNYIGKEGATYVAPHFKGISLVKLPPIWQPQIEKLIADKSLLEEDRPNVFLLEADIDEHGIIHKIVELNGALKQYSQVFIDKIYDLAVRGWEPAKCNGIPFRTVVQFRFEVTR